MRSGCISSSSRRMPAGLELEDAGGVAAAEQLEHLLIVEVDAVEVERMRLAAPCHRSGGSCRPRARSPRRAGSRTSRFASSIVESVRSPRKSILSRPIFSHVGPSHCVTTSSVAARLVQRHDVVQRLRRDRPRPRRGSRVPGLALERLRRVDQLRRTPVLRVVQPLAARAPSRSAFSSVISSSSGTSFAMPSAVGQRRRPCTRADVPDRRPRLERSERDDLRDVPVLLRARSR